MIVAQVSYDLSQRLALHNIQLSDTVFHVQPVLRHYSKSGGMRIW